MQFNVSFIFVWPLGSSRSDSPSLCLFCATLFLLYFSKLWLSHAHRDLGRLSPAPSQTTALDHFTLNPQNSFLPRPRIFGPRQKYLLFMNSGSQK